MPQKIFSKIGFETKQYEKRLKTEFLDPEIGTADNKNAIKTPFHAILSPKKGMGGFVIDIQEKSQSLGSFRSLF